MIKIAGIFVGTALILTGCGESAPKPQIKIDQIRRERIFKDCMKNLPAGPIATQYNDWDEVVDSCAATAYSLSWICVANCETTDSIQRVPEVENK